MSLAAAGSALPVTYRQGTVLTFNPATLENTIEVGNGVFTNVPLLGVAEAASITEGSAVAIMCIPGQWFIIGLIVTPGTDAAIEAITRVSQQIKTDAVSTAEDRSAATWGDLATYGPRCVVQVKASGRVLVNLGVTINPDFFGAAGVEAVGPTVVAPDFIESYNIEGNIVAIGGSRLILFEDLVPGASYTFTMKYISDGQPSYFSGRTLTVEAI